MFKIMFRSVLSDKPYQDFHKGVDFLSVPEAQEYISFYVDWIDMQLNDYIVVSVEEKEVEQE